MSVVFLQGPVASVEGPAENREMLGTTGTFSERRSLAFAPSGPALGWAGLGWAGLCGVLGAMSSPPQPHSGSPFSPPPPLLCSLTHRSTGWGGGRPGRLCLGLECVLLQLKYLEQLSGARAL